MAARSAPRILVVEDDHDARMLLAERLAREGYVVDAAANAADAIHELESTPPPYAIIVDLLMPGIIGQSLLEYLRHDRRYDAVRIAIVSASPELAPEGYRVFPKPLDTARLLEYLRPESPPHARATAPHA